MAVIGEHRTGTDEDAVLNGHTLVHGNAVLDLDVITDPDARVDVDAAAQPAARAEHRALADLRVVPYLAARPNGRLWRDIGRRMDERSGTGRGSPVDAHAALR